MANILDKIMNKSSVIEPPKYNLVQFRPKNNGYEIFTKDKYIEYRLSELEGMTITKKQREGIEKAWDRVRKGYDFIIGVGYPTKMFYGVEYFNKNIIGK